MAIKAEVAKEGIEKRRAREKTPAKVAMMALTMATGGKAMRVTRKKVARPGRTRGGKVGRAKAGRIRAGRTTAGKATMAGGRTAAGMPAEGREGAKIELACGR